MTACGYVEPEQPLDRLVGFLITAASRRPDLLAYRTEEATADEEQDPDMAGVVLVSCPEEGVFSVLLAEAFRLMGQDVHPDENAPPSAAQVQVWVKEHGGLRKAARATGYSHTALWRAAKVATQEVEYAGV